MLIIELYLLFDTGCDKYIETNSEILGKIKRIPIGFKKVNKNCEAKWEATTGSELERREHNVLIGF